MAKFNKKTNRLARHARVRNKIAGTPERPRLNVFKSNQNIYAQIINDQTGTTLVSASTLDKEVEQKGSNVESAKAVGQLIGQRAKDKGIETVVFDRSGYLYHGKVKAIAEGARESGLKL